MTLNYGFFNEFKFAMRDNRNEYRSITIEGPKYHGKG